MMLNLHNLRVHAEPPSRVLRKLGGGFGVCGLNRAFNAITALGDLALNLTDFWLKTRNYLITLRRNSQKALAIHGEIDMTVLSLKEMTALEPLEFCQKHSRYSQDQWGYKGHWNRLIARVLDISEKTVEGWGDDFKECPERYKRQLEMIDSLIRAKRLLKKLGIDPEDIEV